MPIIPIIVAAAAAGAILLIALGLAGSSPVDPVQARLTQLGTMQAKNLEELELQQPFVERTLRPLVARLSGSMSRVASSSFQEKAEKRLALAGNPGNLRVADPTAETRRGRRPHCHYARRAWPAGAGRRLRGSRGSGRRRSRPPAAGGRGRGPGQPAPRSCTSWPGPFSARCARRLSPACP